MLNITYKDRNINFCVRERTKVIDLINTVRKWKWSWAGHINRLINDRWTSRVTTWRPYDKKRRQGIPAKRWRDDLDKYWSDTIWQILNKNTRTRVDTQMIGTKKNTFQFELKKTCSQH